MEKFLIVLFCIIPSAGIAAGKLYLVSGEEFPVSDATTAISLLVEQAGEESPKILLFIHGRGAGSVKHPQKALEQMVPALESQYGVGVLLFNWEGSDVGGPIKGFPAAEARQAADDFYSVLKVFESLQESASSQTAELAILTHSMGSIVLEETIRRYTNDLPENIAHAIVISASASRARNHASWLEKSKLTDEHYVVINRSDGALKKVKDIMRRSQRLGQGLKKSRRAENVVYIDFSNAKVGHRYFIAKTKSGKLTGQNKNLCIDKFYRQAFRNHTVDLTGLFHTNQSKNGTVYSVRSGQDPNCK